MANIQRQAFVNVGGNIIPLIYNNGWMEIKDNLRLQSREKRSKFSMASFAQ